MQYIFHILTLANIYIIICLATNFLLGMTGIVSMAQAAFYGLGAYFSAFGLIYLHLPVFPSIILTIIFNSFFSFLIALPGKRLKDDYFVFSTLAFMFIIYYTLYNWVDLSKGPYGISGIPKPAILGTKLTEPYQFFIYSSFYTLVILAAASILIQSPWGRALKAVRNDEISLTSLGRNVARFKTSAFIVSGSFMGIAGYLYATYVSYIDPTSFNFTETIFIISATIIGGTGNVKGPIIGALIVVIVPEALRFIGIPDSSAGPIRQIIYGLILIIIMRFRPWGIAGKFKFD